MLRNDGDNWFMRRVMKDLQDGDPPTIIIGGKKRKGKSFLSMRIGEEIVLRCHQLKFAYRDKGLPTEKRYDLREAQFDVSNQLLYSLKSITSLLEPAPSLGHGLPFGSPIISDESSVTMNSLAFNDRVVKQIVGIHDIIGVRLIPWIFNVPGSVLRIAYQIRETAQYMMQMKARGVAKVYEASPSVTGRVYLKTIGWLGYQNPFTGKIVARITPPTPNTVTVYNMIKDASVNKKLLLAKIKLAELASEGALGPYDSAEDFADPRNAIMMMPKERKHKIPTEDLEEDDEGVEG
jgi:hypothetical protein